MKRGTIKLKPPTYFKYEYIALKNVEELYRKRKIKLYVDGVIPYSEWMTKYIGDQL